MTTTKTRYLTVKAAAKKLQVSPQWIRKIISEGRLEAKKLSRDWIITEQELIKWIQKK